MALRMAARDARRHPARSALVVALIALPLTTMTAFDVLAHTGDLSAEQTAVRQLGTADLQASRISTGPITQTGPTTPARTDYPEAPSSDVRPVLPPGSRAVAVSGTAVDLTVRAGERAATVDAYVAPLGDPLTSGMFVLHEGTPAGPGQIGLSPALRDALGVSVGDQIDLPSLGRRVTVTAVVSLHRASETSDARHAVAPLESLPGLDADLEWLVDLPDATSPEDAKAALNANGALVTLREDTAAGEQQEAGAALAVMVVPAVMILAEVVLLAGAAFAVSARRQRRTLGLFGAAGADRRQLRRVVLATGVVLGGVGGLIGVTLGVAVAAVARGPVDAALGYQLGTLDVHLLDLTVLVAIATGTALLAAALPARTAARQSVTDALAARAGTRRARRWPLFAGVPLAVAGVLVTLLPGQLDDDGDFAVVGVGAVIAQLGLLLCVPALMGAAGALGARMPLAARFALRDAARNRARTAPAVAAVTAVVATAVSMLVLAAGFDARARDEYVPSGPAGSVQLNSADGRLTPRLVEKVAATLPTTGQAVRYNTHIVGLARADCPMSEDALVSCPKPNQLLIADTATLRILLGRADAAAERHLIAGGVVAFDDAVVTGGRSTVWPIDADRGKSEQLPALTVELPRRLLGDYNLAGVIAPQTAKRLGFDIEPMSYTLLTSRMPTEQEEARLQAILLDAGVQNDAGVERGHRSDLTTLLAWALAGVALITLGSVAVATALALAENRADLDTLHTVGASPALRRQLAGWQAATICLLGAVLGIAAGLVPAAAVLRGGGIPYATVLPVLAIIALGLPLLSWLGAALATRSTRYTAYRLP